ncbi:hypothetical protein HPB51_010291 [Rhipicephalus microplus]|uniref:Uncharacterized protein n=1 Tax=Rhipicephalus microplus TaxID=6941 RepID=A0A9J6D4Y3_RHIMP|nr:hypothetical protein HPB51_010291 [Rhipicephalus microplus]
MRRLGPNFDVDGEAMTLKFKHLSDLVQYYDSTFFRSFINLHKPGGSVRAPDASTAFVFFGDQLEAPPTGPGPLGGMFVSRVPGGLRAAGDRPNDLFRAAGSRQRGAHAVWP